MYDAGYQRIRQIKRGGPVTTGSFVDDILYVVPSGFEVHRNQLGQVTSSIATTGGVSITTYFDPITGLAVVGAGIAAQTTSLSGPNTITQLILADHLGSMVAEFTMTSTTTGTLVVHGFGPWGNARNASSPFAEGQRGFTGHEHLAELGIIHMNGRLYDPVLGRFLQADPIIQAPHNAQSHNRYAYVMNNPLSFSDPSGFSAWTKWRGPIIGIVVSILTYGAASYAMVGYAGAYGSTAFATVSASGTASLTTVGTATAVAASGFASGGINGGNIQSALRGAFMAVATFGVLQGIEALAGAAGSTAGSSVGASTAADTTSGTYSGTAGATATDAASQAAAQLPQFQRVEITGPSWTGDALDWLTKGPVDRNSVSGAIWMGMMAMPGLSRGASAARGATVGARRLAANQEIGRVGEKFLADTYGGSQQVTKSTTLGVRRLDNLADGVARESKVGRTALTTRVEAQILKNVELMNNPAISGVYSVEWHFFSGSTGIGPTAPLLRRLQECLITVCRHQ